MKKHCMTLTLILVISSTLFAQPYNADWSSLSTRPTPQWWKDAKFGIFIHWGVYSVPAFSKVGEYSEWYWSALRRGKPEYVEFHHLNYGQDFQYADFVPLFTCELFDPAQWADVFKRSGAKYVVLTSKHHDGFTLWPSQQANRSWGRAWNSLDAGPERDLLGELTYAVRQENLKMGIYYSLYEWFNPLYRADVDLYVEKHMIPQFEDVVNRYRPSVIFSDGEWDHPKETWKSEELLAWLFNESPSQNDVVINDRWGKGDRHKYGGYYTTEYGAGLPDAEHPWEENRGMAYSFGYSRTENLDDYNSSRELLLMLIDIVSRGGNFLLDIGPTADGRIPVIMQERLIDIGDWLHINGQAIYGTTTWKKSCQWSDGEILEIDKEKRDQVEYDIVELTISPKPGKAVKEFFFTRKGNTLYAIASRLPGDRLTIRNIDATLKTEISLLGYEKTLAWQKEGNDLIIQTPKLYDSPLRYQHAFTFKITNIQSF